MKGSCNIQMYTSFSTAVTWCLETPGIESETVTDGWEKWKNGNSGWYQKGVKFLAIWSGGKSPTELGAICPGG